MSNVRNPSDPSVEKLSNVVLKNEMDKNVLGDITKDLENALKNSYEVFRNNTTAVEVIVKEVPSCRRKKSCAMGACNQDKTIMLLQDEIEQLKMELDEADSREERVKTSFQHIIFEMKRQKDKANENEFNYQTKNLELQLENEKLKVLVETKTKIINNFKKELMNMKRMIKCVIKGIMAAPKVPDSITFVSDSEFDDLKKDLTKDTRNNQDSSEAGVTFDSHC